MDSLPSMNSRNSSLGKQIPLGIRSALDNLSHFHGPNVGQQMKRKRSIPEMSQNQQQQIQPQSTEFTTTTRIQSSPDQLLLHPNRRSTCDTSTLRLKVRDKKTTHHQKRSPPRITSSITNSPLPSSQSTSSGISSSSSRSTANPNDSSMASSLGGPKHTKEPIIAEDEDDYILLSTPKVQQKQQQQLNVRSIGTILESSSPCSSHSSDGEQKRRSTKMVNYFIKI